MKPQSLLWLPLFFFFHFPHIIIFQVLQILALLHLNYIFSWFTFVLIEGLHCFLTWTGAVASQLLFLPPILPSSGLSSWHTRVTLFKHNSSSGFAPHKRLLCQFFPNAILLSIVPSTYIHLWLAEGHLPTKPLCHVTTFFWAVNTSPTTPDIFCPVPELYVISIISLTPLYMH